MLLQHKKVSAEVVRIHEASRQGVEEHLVTTTKIGARLLDKKIIDNKSAHENDQSEVTIMWSLCSKRPAQRIFTVKFSSFWFIVERH